MRYIELNPAERATLREACGNHSSKDFRSHCQAILLSSHGLPVKQIASVLEVRTRTVYTWMDRWESEGICGLMIRNGRGRKPKLSITDAKLVGLIKKNGRLCTQPQTACSWFERWVRHGNKCFCAQTILEASGLFLETLSQEP